MSLNVKINENSKVYFPLYHKSFNFIRYYFPMNPVLIWITDKAEFALNAEPVNATFLNMSSNVILDERKA